MDPYTLILQSRLREQELLTMKPQRAPLPLWERDAKHATPVQIDWASIEMGFAASPLTPPTRYGRYLPSQSQHNLNE